MRADRSRDPEPVPEPPFAESSDDDGAEPGCCESLVATERGPPIGRVADEWRARMAVQPLEAMRTLGNASGGAPRVGSPTVLSTIAVTPAPSPRRTRPCGSPAPMPGNRRATISPHERRVSRKVPHERSQRRHTSRRRGISGKVLRPLRRGQPAGGRGRLRLLRSPPRRLRRPVRRRGEPGRDGARRTNAGSRDAAANPAGGDAPSRHLRVDQ